MRILFSFEKLPKALINKAFKKAQKKIKKISKKSVDIYIWMLYISQVACDKQQIQTTQTKYGEVSKWS